ncbi:hypothetical protein [Acinetobacter sp. SFB]|uniref:hypothetical protein n=1 Tax=Acinetobacter sp. SFB TaxID=1805634 RepID=UPI000AAB1F82|nr:hypothetical protein [Acinetobacter sp. SFB]
MEETAKNFTNIGIIGYRQYNDEKEESFAKNNDNKIVRNGFVLYSICISSELRSTLQRA